MSFHKTTIMLSILPTLLLAGSAAAQITTSFAIPESNFGTDKIGFYGSVVSMVDGHTAMVIQFDNGTNTQGLGRMPPQLYTLGPTYFGFSQDISAPPNSLDRTNGSASDNDDTSYTYACEWPETPANASLACSVSYGPVIGRNVQCQSRTQASSTALTTFTYTYSGRLSYSAGVETVTRAIVLAPQTHSRPDFCSQRRGTGDASSSYPGWSFTTSLARSQIATYQVVITAGQEKLSATQGASASSSVATPTGGAAESGSTGAAVPMKTAGPMVMGLGAAAAVFL